MEWTGGWMWSGLCHVAAAAWTQFCVSIGSSEESVYQSPFSLPHSPPKGGRPTLGEERLLLCPLYPGSNQNLLEPHSSFTQEQSQVKARALTNLLWSLILTLPDARPLNAALLLCKGEPNDIMYKNQDLKSLEIKSTGSSLSVNQANADSIHYLAVAEEAAASCVRYSRSSLAAWKRP